MTAPKPVVLIVRDGWGTNPNPQHDAFNAVKLARTPCCDALLKRYPHTLIHTSGEDVGLPDRTMGNSEVGHQNLGAGRIVNHDSVRITQQIHSGEFFKNPAMIDAVQNARHVHLLGIASDAGVHGRLDHLYACVELCQKLGQIQIDLHLFTDGRDTGPYTGLKFIQKIERELNNIGAGRIATIVGRYYAMDRDNRWDRVEQAYNLLTGSSDAMQFDNAPQAIQHYYDNPTNSSQQGDEFITPRKIGDAAEIADGDAVIFYNYRGDRPRELTRAFMQPDFFGNVPPSPETGAKGFNRPRKLDLKYVCMTAYDQTFRRFKGLSVAFAKPPKMVNIGGEYFAQIGKTQFRCAETEKFPHVTFFFNDYREEPFEGESRELAPSAKVATYDLKPQMSAHEITKFVLDRIAAADCEDFILVNLANGDMVGHTGKLDAAIQAIETVDGCVGEVVEATLARGGKLIVTADHGNAEQMFDPLTNAPHTAHTIYDVEAIVVDPDLNIGTPLSQDGRLSDIMPTVLQLMMLPQPKAMTGISLLSQELGVTPCHV